MMENEIKLFRLYTGEELIASLTKTESGDYFAKNITVLFPTQSNSLGLAPFMPYSKIGDTGVELRAKDVMFITEPIEDLANQYKSMHGKVVTPPQKKIII
jgi:hypothetical protein